MKELIEAVNNVMTEVVNIDKNLKVGEGKYSYQGVSDKDVKLALNPHLAKNGLAIFTKNIQPVLDVHRYKDQYGKEKQSVFVEVLATYRLVHVSGQEVEIMGYGHGIDSGDKAAGKATTYALKNALLYNFMVATGGIDDADNTHSNDIEVPKQVSEKPDNKAWLNPNDTNWAKVVKAMKDGFTIDQVKKKYAISKDNQKKLEDEVQN